MTAWDGLRTTRRKAAHCDALLQGRQARVEPSADPVAFGKRIASGLLPVIADVWGNPAVRVTSLAPRTIALAELPSACGDAINFAHRLGNEDRVVLLSLPREQMLQQVDRAFGGPGLPCGAKSRPLSASALLLSKRFANRLACALPVESTEESFGQGHPVLDFDSGPVFAEMDNLHHFSVEIDDGSGSKATLFVTVEQATFDRLAPSKNAAPAGGRPRGRASCDDVPLASCARLVDMSVPLHRIARLEVGAVIPVMISRDVPLLLEDVVVARGTVGDVDHQAALQITQICLGKDRK